MWYKATPHKVQMPNSEVDFRKKNWTVTYNKPKKIKITQKNLKKKKIFNTI